LPWCRGSPNSNPFSSCAHLILIPALNGWPDQGQFIDVMVRLGTLLAIFIYFWRDVIKLIKGALLLFMREVAPEGGLVIYIGLPPSRPSPRSLRGTEFSTPSSL